MKNIGIEISKKLLYLLSVPKEPVPSSLPGLWKYPTNRDDAIKSSTSWIKGKQADDGAEGLWRVRDDLYDLSGFVDKHPGGAEWLEITKGTDITEAFEAHHLNPSVEKHLKQFHVRRAKSPRNSPYTFREDGFYKTLKRKVRVVLGDDYSGPTFESKLITDLLLTGTLVSAVLSAAWQSYGLAMVSGSFLALTAIAAHNFFHQKDNFRMYYFHLCFLSSRDWRISHSLSHHIYPNSVLDLEVSLFEPFFHWLPDPSKTWFSRYGSWLYSPIIYSVMFHSQILLRLGLMFKGEPKMVTAPDALSFLIPVVMMFCGGSGLKDTLLLWTTVLISSSFFFGLIGLNAGHHHPEVFHDGDTPRKDMDWGLFQLDAVRERKEVMSCTFLALVSFGHHALHHLFPFLDHGRLQQLYPALEDTCKEFGIPFEVSTVWEMLSGQFRQLARTEPNPLPRDINTDDRRAARMLRTSRINCGNDSLITIRQRIKYTVNPWDVSTYDRRTAWRIRASRNNSGNNSLITIRQRIKYTVNPWDVSIDDRRAEWRIRTSRINSGNNSLITIRQRIKYTVNPWDVSTDDRRTAWRIGTSRINSGNNSLITLRQRIKYTVNPWDVSTDDRRTAWRVGTSRINSGNNSLITIRQRIKYTVNSWDVSTDDRRATCRIGFCHQ